MTQVTSIEWEPKGIGKQCTITTNDGWTHEGWGYDSKEATKKAINEMLTRVHGGQPHPLDSKQKAAGETE